MLATEEPVSERRGEFFSGVQLCLLSTSQVILTELCPGYEYLGTLAEEEKFHVV